MKVLVIGSGPIIIGQAAEFDYSGVQACRQLKKEGIEIILLNSNPATIMTDSNIADKVYIEPIKPEFAEKIIKKEKPDGILAGFGGQTSLNLAYELHTNGVLEKYNVKLLGTNIEAIEKSENRQQFKNLMQDIGVPIAYSCNVSSLEEAQKAAKSTGFPLVIRPAYTLGGNGSSYIKNKRDFTSATLNGLNISPVHQILIEKSLYGFKEIEFEVMRDKNNNCITICTMENFDPTGIHTGDSIVVAPTQTISKAVINKLKDVSYKIITALGIEGGCNIQYAINPNNENEFYAIEVNPRVSRSSALASKATGFPIAKISTMLALGHTLTDFCRDIKSLEPKPDYVAVKIPKFSFDKFENIDKTLSTGMKSTGEIMAIGKTFEEAILKGLESIEQKPPTTSTDYTVSDDKRIYRIINALSKGVSAEEISAHTNIEKYFIEKLKKICNHIPKHKMYYHNIKVLGNKNKQASYYYSSKQKNSENTITDNKNKKILIIGSGPIKIGQGIEFDYCCVKAAEAIKKKGFESIIINSNPETLSTDYDIATRLYFEPLAPKYINKLIDYEKPDGILVQFGGQTAINLLNRIKKQNILGTTPESINITENRILFNKFLKEINIPHPKSYNSNNIKFPAVLRPSYIIGGSGVHIVKTKKELDIFKRKASKISADVLIDEYIRGIECEADIISDGENISIIGFIEHIERSGIHSGDSISVYPSINITNKQKNIMKNYSLNICKALKVKGLINIQFIISDNNIYVLEVNPRASRTIPMMGKMTGYPVCETAIDVILGKKIKQTEILKEPDVFGVKMPIFSNKQLGIGFPKLSSQMQSTGEVLGIDTTYEKALQKAFLMGYKELNQNIFSCKDTEKAYNSIKKSIDSIEKLSIDTINNYIMKGK